MKGHGGADLRLAEWKAALKRLINAQARLREAPASQEAKVEHARANVACWKISDADTREGCRCARTTPTEAPVNSVASGIGMTTAELALVRSLEAAVAELRERAEQAEQRAVTAEAGRAAERTRADALADQAHVLQAELATARANAQVSDQARIAAEHAHAEASVSLVALSEQLEAFEADEVARCSLGRLARLRRAWRGE
jgi:hypothetical protein